MESSNIKARSGRLHAFTGTVAAIIAGLALVAGCGGSDGDGPTVNVELFGWANATQGASDGSFYRKMKLYPEAELLSVKLTQPGDGRILSQDSYAIVEDSAKLPDLTFGENVRLDFDVVKRDSQGRGVRIASAATPIFSIEPGSKNLDFSVMAIPTRDFAPVGARFTTNAQTGEWEYQTVTFDNRTNNNRYWGRVGHRAARTSDGKVVIVGGAPDVTNSLGKAPKLTELGAHRDIQIFDPATGYASNIAYNDSTGQARPNGADQLSVGRAYHTLTPLGNDRYLAVGGLTWNASSQSTRASGAIDVIDLNADPGSRVAPLVGANGNLTLKHPRAMHTATYRSTDNTVVVVGGVGVDGKSKPTVEVIDLSNRVVRQAGQLQTGRAQHTAIRLDGQGEAIWVLGGWSTVNGALKTTEILSPQGTTYTSRTAGAMATARYDMAATKISSGGGSIVTVCGGYTSTQEADGAPDDTCEIGHSQRGWSSQWTLPQGRGGGRLIELSQSDDLVLLGGRNGSGDEIGEAIKLSFRGPSQDPPYRVEQDMGTMVTARFGATATRLNNGMILLTGGVGKTDRGDAPLASFEYYNPEDIVTAKSDDGGNGDGGSPGGMAGTSGTSSGGTTSASSGGSGSTTTGM